MRIGKIELSGKVVLAPMAGVTDPPFRRMVQRFGVSALWTEMISARGVTEGYAFRTMELNGHTVPTIFQLYGKEPAVMGRAARIVQDRGSFGVDINMGCPVKKVVRDGAGAALMKNTLLAAKIVAAVRHAVTIPVTVKIRAGWDETNLNAPDFAKVLEAEGADAVVVHSRARSKGHSGPVSLSLLGEVKAKVRIPVLGNGGVFNEADAVAMIQNSGCDGVMIGRGALGRPWVPGRVMQALSGMDTAKPERYSLRELICDHYEDELEWIDRASAVRRMRKHLVWYSKGLPTAGQFRKAVLRLEDPDRILESVREFFDAHVIA
ncbi:MAG: tRNA dihydrouridine synthase DusB [Thermodesulfobacteriota bacterium]